MPKRIAFVASAESGEELAAGTNDAARIYALLTQPRFGECNSAASTLLPACSSRYEFEQRLHGLIEAWDSTNQLVLYFSGHGEIRNGIFSIVFGRAKKTFLTYSQLAADLAAAGVTRAIIIIDSCHSGAIHTGGEKGQVERAFVDPSVFPKGIALLTSCERHEKSYELADRSGSLFTSLLAEAIETGLGSTQTPDGRISVDDALGYIRRRFDAPEFSEYSQKPLVSVRSADQLIWIAHNVTVATPIDDGVPSNSNAKGARTYGELKVLFEATAHSQRPCSGPTADDLAAPVLRSYADKLGRAIPESQHEAARKLGFFSALSPGDLTQAAVLCFTDDPQKYFPHARAVQLIGSRGRDDATRLDVVGPLANQVAILVNEIERALSKLNPHLDPQIASLRGRVIREAISNAIVHRAYELSSHVQVTVDFEAVTIRNPGKLLNGGTWEELVATRNASLPHDAAVAWYLTNLLQFEGVGRGFSKYREYIGLAGKDALTCIETEVPPIVELTIRTPRRPPQLTPITASVSIEPSPETRSWPRSQISLEDETNAGIELTQSLNRAAELHTEQHELRRTVGRYEVVNLIGQGGQATVYLARDPVLDRNVAIKVLSRRYTSIDSSHRFLREARAIARLSHPNIVTIFEVGAEEDDTFIAMEYVEGEQVTRWSERETGLQSLEARVRIVQDVAKALHHAHSAGLIHRDVKPSNIIVTSEGVPKLLDFGLARIFEEDLLQSSLTVSGAIIGTPMYMSPEQFRGESITPAADIYSLGMVLFELLFGTRPFKSGGIHEMMRSAIDDDPSARVRGTDRYNRTPAELRAICFKAIEKSPQDRYSSAIQFADDLNGFLKGTKLSVVRQSWWKRVLRW